MTARQEGRPEEMPFDEPAEEPPGKPTPYAEPSPADDPGRPVDPQPSVPPEFLWRRVAIEWVLTQRTERRRSKRCWSGCGRARPASTAYRSAHVRFCRHRRARPSSSSVRLLDPGPTRSAFPSPTHPAIGCASGWAFRTTTFTTTEEWQLSRWAFAIQDAWRAVMPLPERSVQRCGALNSWRCCRTSDWRCCSAPMPRTMCLGGEQAQRASGIFEIISPTISRFHILRGGRGCGRKETHGFVRK